MVETTQDVTRPAALAQVTMSAPHPPDEWNPPPVFDLVKEMNGHAGRPATFLTLFLAATIFSVGNGPVHEALYQTPDLSYVLLIVMLCLLVWDLSIGLISVLVAMEPAVEPIQASRQSWESLLETKHRNCERAFNAFSASVMALIGVWAASIFRGPAPFYVVGYVLVFMCAVAALPLLWPMQPRNHRLAGCRTRLCGGGRPLRNQEAGRRTKSGVLAVDALNPISSD